MRATYAQVSFVLTRPKRECLPCIARIATIDHGSGEVGTGVVPCDAQQRRRLAVDDSHTACKERIQLGDHARGARELVYQVGIPSGFRRVSRGRRVTADAGLEVNSKQGSRTIGAGAEQRIMTHCLLMFPADVERSIH